ncbi:sulfite exporter TauE/SafE family protein [Neiella marina]|uniref:Probable membrane transporter protein n=1 Tax=Neiella holothuriorum TaxID=2870530 RepID=A0ABS7EBS6_9GAMM|nr:sulfite exporter TauE/SafE family protein [Neiella holothuriorum]MBW8189775.1 sulfite exporter TauE/SafE family protein [Neiella holothuriorum]
MEGNVSQLISDWLPIAAAMVGTGVVAGLLAGLLGVGGGIVIVPVFYFVLLSIDVPAASAMLVATGTSLLVIIPTSISSIRAHHKRGNVDWALIKRWAPVMVIGVIAGSQTALVIDGVMVSSVFGVIAILVALNMLFRAKSPPLAQQLPGTAGQGVMAGGIGFFSVMIGIGGGTLGVPTLTSCNYPSHRAVGTAAVFGLLISLPGATTMLLAPTPVSAPAGMLGLVNLPAAAAIIPLTVLLAPVGAWIGSKLDAVLLKKLFAVFLCVSGGRMLIQVFGA